MRWGDRHDVLGAAVGLVVAVLVGGCLVVFAGAGAGVWWLSFGFGAAAMNVTSAILRRRAGSPGAISGREFKRRIPIVLGFIALIVAETVGWNVALGHTGRVPGVVTAIALGVVMFALILRHQSQQHQ